MKVSHAPPHDTPFSLHKVRKRQAGFLFVKHPLISPFPLGFSFLPTVTEASE